MVTPTLLRKTACADAMVTGLRRWGDLDTVTYLVSGCVRVRVCVRVCVCV